MTQSSQVSASRAVYYHLFSDMKHFLLTAGTLCFLGKRVISYLRKDDAHFMCLDKIRLSTKNYFAFYHFASVVSPFYFIASDISDGISCLKGTETHQDVRARRKGHFPRRDNPYIGVKTWMFYKSASSLFRMISSLLLVHETFKALGIFNKSFSPLTHTIGGGLNILGSVIDIIDIRRAMNDHDRDVVDENFPSDAKIKEPQNDDREIHRENSQRKRRYDQVCGAIVICLTAVGMIRNVGRIEGSGLIGRISQFVADHTEDIYGGLLTTLNVMNMITYAHCGATIQQLETRDVNQKG